MRASAVVCIGIGVSVGAAAYAAEHTSTVEQGPDIELLEYLGNLVDERGTLIGPDDMHGPVDPRDAPSPPNEDDTDGDADKVKP
jgi:hypothetical protein